MIHDIVLIPLYAQKHRPATNFTQWITNFTPKGREKIHQNLECINKDVLRHIQRFYIKHRTIEYNDNRLSKFVAQFGKCSITGIEFGLNDSHCHHIRPKGMGGTDDYRNLTLVLKNIHQAIHAQDVESAKTILSKNGFTEENGREENAV